jgi:predicted nucleic acid-binding protein
VIYLDTSALIKLHLVEDGSESVFDLIQRQDDPLPVWELQEAELVNALHLKVFRRELSRGDAAQQISAVRDRQKAGYYFMPDLDRSSLLQSFHQMAVHTQQLGCRTLDVLHVACANQLRVGLFVTFDARQQALAKKSGLAVWSGGK